EQRVLRMQIDVRLRCVRRQARRFAAAGHRVPLIANASRVEHEREFVVETLHREMRWRRYETCLAIRMIVAAILEQAWSTGVSRMRYGPLNRRELVIRLLAQRREAADVEGTRAGILRGRQRCVLAKNISSAGVRERFAESHTPRDFGDDPPIGLCFAGSLQERALTRDASVRVRDGAVLLTPGRGR